MADDMNKETATTINLIRFGVTTVGILIAIVACARGLGDIAFCGFVAACAAVWK